MSQPGATPGYTGREAEALLGKLFQFTRTKFVVATIGVFVVSFAYFSFHNVYVGQNILHIIEQIGYDQKLKFRKVRKSSGQVAVVAIGEKTLAQLGRFPFPRKHYVSLLKQFKEANVSVVAFDIVFPEQEHSLALQTIDRIQQKYTRSKDEFSRFLRQEKRKVDYDQAMADELAGLRVVMGYPFEHKKVDFAVDFSEVPVNHQTTVRQNRLLSRSAIRLVRSSLQDSTLDDHIFMRGHAPVISHEKVFSGADGIRLGFFNAHEDSDGLIRKTPLVGYYEGRFYPSLSMKALELHLQALFEINISDFGMHDFRFNGTTYTIPVEQSGMLLVNFLGGPGHSIKRHEFVDVINGDVPREELEGKIVFVGTQAAGLHDNKATPVDPNFPGVEIHATVADSVLRNDYLIKGEYYLFYGIGLLLFGGILFAVVTAYLNPVFATLFSIVFIAGMVAVDFTFFFSNGHVVPVVYPALQFVVLLFGSVIYQYLGQEKEKKFIKNAFSHYVSDSVVNEIMKDHSNLKFGGQERDMTVMFADIVGFTKISEKMSPENISRLLKEFFSEMTGVIMGNKGTLDKYMGDAIMCFWGAPLPQENHAELACKTAMEMVERMDALNERIESEFGCRMGLRIGINSGMMIVGNMGSYQHFDYTVLGDTVNLAAHMECYNRYLHTNILMGPNTYEQIRDKFNLRMIDRVKFMGKEEVVTVYELMGQLSGDPQMNDFRESFERGVEQFWKQDWDDAKRSFKFCLKIDRDDYASKLFIKRIEYYRNKELDAEWTGEQNLKVK